MNDLVLYLRDLRDSAGLSVAVLHDRLVEEMRGQLEGPPAEQTLHRRLRGVNLHIRRQLVDAVVVVCTREAGTDTEAAKEYARALLDRADVEMRPAGPAASPLADASDDLERHRQEIRRLRREIQAKEIENLRLVAEVTAVRQLLSSLARPRAEGPAGGDESIGDLLNRFHQLAAGAEEALAEAQAARDETARLREWLIPSAAAREDHRLVHGTNPRNERASHDRTAADAELAYLVGQFRRRDPTGALMAEVIENTRSSIFDGGRTGRFDWNQLHRTEKALFTTTVGRAMQQTFALAEGSQALDFMLDGIDFDVRYSRNNGGWAFPPGLLGALCAVIHSDDRTGQFSYGVVRVTPEHLNSRAANRDMKRALNTAGRAAIRWVHQDKDFRTSILLRLGEADREAVLLPTTGHQRMTELLRRAEGRLLSRDDIATVCRQPDPIRRLREVVRHIRTEGVLVVSGASDDRSLLTRLGAPEPGPHQWVSLRLAPAGPEDPGPTIELDGSRWRKAGPEDPEVVLPTDQRLRVHRTPRSTGQNPAPPS